MQTCPASTLDLFTDSIRIMGDGTLCGIMEFSIQLDPGRLAGAARACYAAHPILHSRLVRGRGPAYWELLELAPVLPVPVEECSGDYHPRVLSPVDPYGEVQARVRLLRRPFGDVVVINLSHAAADAFGLQVLMSQLLEEYEKPGSLSPATGGIPERDTLWTWDLIGGTAKKPAEMKVIDPMWPDPLGRSGAPSSFHRFCIPAAELAGIRNRARELGGSINDVLTAAYFLAMSDLSGYRGTFPLYFPVNLRRHLRDGSRVMSNQAVNVAFPLERRPGEGMEEILPRIIHKIAILKAGGIGLAEQAEMDACSDPEGRYVHQMVERMAALQETGLADIFFTNPGPFSLPDLPGLADAYVCYPGGYMPTTCFVASTFRGTLTITMGYQDSRQAREGTRRAMELFRYHLLSIDRS